MKHLWELPTPFYWIYTSLDNCLSENRKKKGEKVMSETDPPHYLIFDGSYLGMLKKMDEKKRT